MSIEILRDIARIVSQSTIKYPELPDLERPRTKVDKLIWRLAHGEPLESVSETRVLQSRARRRLLNALLFLTLDPEKSTEYARAYLENQRRLFWMKALLILAGRRPAMRLARIGLAQAEKFNFTSNCLEFANELRNNAYLEGNRSEFEKMCGKVLSQLKIYEAELLALQEHDRIGMRYTRSTARQLELAHEAVKAREAVEALMTEVTSNLLVSIHFRVSVFSSQISQQYHETLTLCNRIEKYYKEHPHFKTKAIHLTWLLSKFESLLLLKGFEEARKVIEESDRLLEKGTNNWFVQRELGCMLEMQALNFTEAERLLKEVVRHHRFTLQSSARQEKWEVFQLYLDYALGKPIGKLAVSLTTIRERVPIYSKDKEGVNIAVLIIHILLLVRANQLDEIVIGMEALQTYRYRHVQGSTNRQSAIFLKLLRVMERESFDKQRVIAKSQKLVEQLKNSTPSHSEMSEMVQIIPFQWLWECVLEDLGKIRK